MACTLYKHVPFIPIGSLLVQPAVTLEKKLFKQKKLELVVVIVFVLVVVYVGVGLLFIGYSVATFSTTISDVNNDDY